VSPIAVVVLAVLAVALAVWAALPLSRGADDVLPALTDAQRERLALREERDDTLAALRELEIDHRTGKIADEDYREAVVDLRRRAATALRALRDGT